MVSGHNINVRIIMSVSAISSSKIHHASSSRKTASTATKTRSPFKSGYVFINNKKIKLGATLEETVRNINKRFTETGVKAKIVDGRLVLVSSKKSMSIKDPNKLLADLVKNNRIGKGSSKDVQIVALHGSKNSVRVKYSQKISGASPPAQGLKLTEAANAALAKTRRIFPQRVNDIMFVLDGEEEVHQPDARAPELNAEALPPVVEQDAPMPIEALIDIELDQPIEIFPIEAEINLNAAPPQEIVVEPVADPKPLMPKPPMEARIPEPPMEARVPKPPMEARIPEPPMEARVPEPPREARRGFFNNEEEGRIQLREKYGENSSEQILKTVNTKFKDLDEKVVYGIGRVVSELVKDINPDFFLLHEDEFLREIQSSIISDNKEKLVGWEKITIF